MSKLYIVLCFVLVAQSVRSDESDLERNEIMIRTADNALQWLDIALITLQNKVDNFTQTVLNTADSLKETASATNGELRTYVQNSELEIQDVVSRSIFDDVNSINCPYDVAKSRNFLVQIAIGVDACTAVALQRHIYAARAESEEVNRILEKVKNFKNEAAQCVESMMAQPVRKAKCITLAGNRKELITSSLIPRVLAATDKIVMSEAQAKKNIRSCVTSNTYSFIKAHYDSVLIQINKCKQ